MNSAARSKPTPRGRFVTKTDPNGQPWAPLSPTTLEIYDSEWFKALVENIDYRDGIPGSLLQRTNRMRRTLTHNVGDGWVDIGTSRATKGGKWQVGWLHETGTTQDAAARLLDGRPGGGHAGRGRPGRRAGHPVALHRRRLRLSAHQAAQACARCAPP